MGMLVEGGGYLAESGSQLFGFLVFAGRFFALRRRIDFGTNGFTDSLLTNTFNKFSGFPSFCGSTTFVLAVRFPGSLPGCLRRLGHRLAVGAAGRLRGLAGGCQLTSLP
jgi:hypothetical protein